jgi:uncharacterized protein (DUF1810 family)
VSTDPYDLERFVFPQIHGLGSSRMAERYAISSVDEARAYLQHPLLGPRLRGCTQLLLDAQNADAVEILGSIDAQKLQSSMTLFMRADPDRSLFVDVLAMYFDGIPDAGTDERL